MCRFESYDDEKQEKKFFIFKHIQQLQMHEPHKKFIGDHNEMLTRK